MSPGIDYDEMKRKVDTRDLDQDGYVWLQKKYDHLFHQKWPPCSWLQIVEISLLWKSFSTFSTKYFFERLSYSLSKFFTYFFLHVHSFYWPLFLIFGLILPLNAPLEYWDESMTETILITGVLRFAITVNVSWLVNSARLVWSMEGKKLIQISDTFNLLYKLFFKMPKSHGTVMINYDGINVE